MYYYNTIYCNSLGGGGGGDCPSFQGFDPLPNQRVPLCTVLRYPFWMINPKIFQRTPLAPIYTYFEGDPKKRNFLVNFFSIKCLKRLFRPVFSKFLPAAQKLWPKQGLFSALGELGKSI